MRKLFLLFVLSNLAAMGQAKKIITIHFSPTFNNAPLVLDKYFKTSETDSVNITILRFYISNVFLSNQGKIKYIEPTSYHLVDASISKSLNLKLTVPDSIKFDEVHFNLGIDSLTNSAGAMGGELDPTKGMYWTWQSGYINFKLEGHSNLCQTRKNEYDFHLGGFLPPNNAMVPVSLKTKDNKQINVELPLDIFIREVDLSHLKSVMIPSPDAVRLSQTIARLFRIQSP